MSFRHSLRLMRAPALVVAFAMSPHFVQAQNYLNPSGSSYFAGGSVAIGTTSPANTFDVYGTGIHIQSGVPSSTSMSLYNNSGTLTWNGVALETGASVSGTTNYLPVFTSASSLGNSVVYQSGSNVGIGTTAPANSLTL